MSDVPSNKPYLIRALHQWCTDFGFTPFIAVFVDAKVDVPMEFVKRSFLIFLWRHVISLTWAMIGLVFRLDLEVFLEKSWFR